jgi:hypothetical protein
MESLNKSNEIVEQNQWNCSTKPMDSFPENVGFLSRNWQMGAQKPVDNNSKFA